MLERLKSHFKQFVRTRWFLATIVLVVVFSAFLILNASTTTYTSSLPSTASGTQASATSSPATTGSAPATGTSIGDAPAGMTLTFDGEFNTFSRYLDKNGNVTCNPGGTGTWQTVYDFCYRTQPANAEQEVYIDPGFLAFLKKESAAASVADSDNPFSTSNGILTIKAAPSSAQVLHAVGSWAKYTSGLITTQFSFSQTYGYFEIRAKLPKGAGLWPAFWLLPEDETWPPEIDAMEAFGAPNPQGDGGMTMIHYASHALKNSNSCGAWHNTSVDITAAFHNYAVDVEPSGITYYFDGKPYATCAANPDVNKPMYMLVNLAVGGWAGSPNAQTSFPASLEVEYVRAYKN